MARPVSLRTTDSYMRDLRVLLRLRTSLVIDSAIDEERRRAAVQHVDELVKLIQVFSAELH